MSFYNVVALYKHWFPPVTIYRRVARNELRKLHHSRGFGQTGQLMGVARKRTRAQAALERVHATPRQALHTSRKKAV